MQNTQYGQREQQSQASLAVVDMAQIWREDVKQIDGSIDDQMQAARLVDYGRIFAATAKEAVQDVIVIMATLLIHSTLAIVLFDSGSTHIVLARAFVDRIGI